MKLLLKNNSKRNRILLLLILLGAVLVTAAGGPETPAHRTHKYWLGGVDTLTFLVQRFMKESDTASAATTKTRFLQCREHYKQIEFVAEYYYPATASRINGAALLDADPTEPEEPQHPTGFQVLEAFVFDSLTAENRLMIRNELSNLDFQLRKLKAWAPDLELKDEDIFDALRLNLYRLIAKGISGFDAPVALSGIQEATATLRSMHTILTYYGAPPEMEYRLISCLDYLKQEGDFIEFDRAEFLSRYLQPVMAAFHEFQIERKVPWSARPAAVHTGSASIFDDYAFDVFFFAPSGAAGKQSAAIISLGQKLFHDKRLSGNGKRSCGSCHEPTKAFTDGMKTNHSISGDRRLRRNTPTLINSALQPVQFADSRIAFLEDQIHAVVTNEQEMAGDLERILKELRGDRKYHPFYRLAYGSDAKSWTKRQVQEALAAYIRSLVRFNSRFDQYIRGNNDALSAEERKGFNLFMGKAKCGTCHYAPVFNGAVPPLYDKMDSEVLGVPENTDTLNPRLDTDSGKYHLHKMPHQLFSFKTPSIRNVALTAPYMHNGVYETLEEVLDFYNRGGGRGLGMDVPTQTLPGERLGLTEAEKKSIIAFMKSLTDTSATIRQTF